MECCPWYEHPEREKEGELPSDEFVAGHALLFWYDSWYRSPEARLNFLAGAVRGVPPVRSLRPSSESFPVSTRTVVRLKSVRGVGKFPPADLSEAAVRRTLARVVGAQFGGS
jgi:hypothetical protein